MEKCIFILENYYNELYPQKLWASGGKILIKSSVKKEDTR